MPIITQPFGDVLSAYRPIVFEFMSTQGPTVPVINAVCRLYFKGDLVSTFRVKSTRTAPALFPGAVEYYFCVDVAERLRDLIAPLNTKPSVFVFDCPLAPIDNTDSIGDFYLDVVYEFLDNDGLIKPQAGVNDITNEFWACNTTRQELESMTLLEFTSGFANRRVLTNSPKTLNICREDNRFLSVLIPPSLFPVNAFRISLYDAAGALIGDAVGLLGAGAFEGHIYTMNTGIENGLKCLLTVSQSPGFDLDSTLIDCYTIEYGVYLIGSFTPVYETFTYCLTSGCKCCEKRSFKIHWLNLLGGVDSYEFCSVKEYSQKTKAVIAQRSKSWVKGAVEPNDITEAALFKTSVDVEFSYRIQSRDLSNDAATWLGEMFGSVATYLEIETNIFVPVIIKDVDQLINRQTGKIKFEFQVQNGYNYYQQNR